MFSSVLLLLLSAPLSADDGLDAWIASVPPPQASIALAQTLPDSPAAIDASVPTTLSAFTRRKLSAQAASSLNQLENDCKSTANVTFVQEEIAASDPVSAHFFDSAIHMRSTFCIDHGTAAQALETFRSEAFRVQAIPLVISYESTQSRSCIGTQSAVGGTLAPTAFCSQTRLYHSGDTHGVVGWLTENTGGDSHQSVYYRHYVIVFKDRPGGGVIGFRGVVTRSKTLGMIQKTLVQTSAGKLHDMMLNKLSTMMADQ